MIRTTWHSTTGSLFSAVERSFSTPEINALPERSIYAKYGVPTLHSEEIPLDRFCAPFVSRYTRAPTSLVYDMNIYLKEPLLVTYGHCSPSESFFFWAIMAKGSNSWKPSTIASSELRRLWWFCCSGRTNTRALSYKKKDKTWGPVTGGPW